MAVKYVKGSEVEKLLPKGKAIVNVTANWCGPCKMFAPVLDEVSNGVPVFKVELDENKDFAQKMNVKGVPTTFFYDNGKITDTVVGFIPKPEVDKRL